MSVKTSIFCALVACLPLTSQAEPYFTNKEGNLIWDKATNLVWQRCSVGQTWDGKTCAGEAKKFTFDEAQKQASNGWRMPTIRELASLIYCSSGQTRSKADLEDGAPVIANQCVSPYSKPTINTSAFAATPERSFWTSSPYVGGSGNAWDVNFSNGYVGDSGYRNYYAAVRLVRASELSGSEAASSFSIKLPDAREAAAAEMKNLLAKGPQQLYLLAGQAQRGKSAEINGKSYSATELYELIVKHFAQSEFAVKASDQLTAMSRSESAARAARAGEERRRQQQSNQNNASRQQCQAQKQTCFASCPPYRSVSSSENSLIVNSAHFDCQRRCTAISCD